VVVSIYVNPAQFSKNEDFGVYPKSLEEDHRRLNALGVNAIFQPASLYAAGEQSAKADSANVSGASELRAGDHETLVQVELLQRPLCGASRPHFFKGVATVVCKLFNIVEPDVAIFGSKDYQQLQVIKKMVRDLDFDIEVVGMPIAREPDGLAMSSRNALLTLENRTAAVRIHKALLWAEQEVKEGRTTSATGLEEAIKAEIADSGGVVDYVQVADADTLEPADKVGSRPSVIAVAAHYGSVRLIDNIQLAL